MAKTKTSTEVKRRWNDAHYTRIVVDVPKEDGQQFREKCKREDISQASILKDAIYKFLRDE